MLSSGYLPPWLPRFDTTDLYGNRLDGDSCIFRISFLILPEHSHHGISTFEYRTVLIDSDSTVLADGHELQI